MNRVSVRKNWSNHRLFLTLVRVLSNAITRHNTLILDLTQKSLSNLSELFNHVEVMNKREFGLNSFPKKLLCFILAVVSLMPSFIS